MLLNFSFSQQTPALISVQILPPRLQASSWLHSQGKWTQDSSMDIKVHSYPLSPNRLNGNFNMVNDQLLLKVKSQLGLMVSHGVGRGFKAVQDKVQ